MPRHRFEKKVNEVSGDRYCKGFTAWIQFLTSLYGADALSACGVHQVFSGTRLTLTVITNRLREMLMGDFDLMELLKLDRKALGKPPNWNKPQQLMLFVFLQ